MSTSNAIHTGSVQGPGSYFWPSVSPFIASGLDPLSGFVHEVYTQVCSGLSDLINRVWEAAKHFFNAIVLFFSSSNEPSPLLSTAVNGESNWTNEKRMIIFNETKQAIEKGYYQNAQNKRFGLRQGHDLSIGSKFIAPVKRSSVTERYPTTQFKVASEDCLEMAQGYVNENCRTAVVNFASPDSPGGDCEEGTNAQEEQICYRSELLGFMQNEKYNRFDGVLYTLDSPDKLGGLIHTPKVQVFRESQAKDFKFLESPFTIGILSSSAPISPRLREINGRVDFLDEEKKELVRTLIRTQLQAAYNEGYQALVLGAFGCGTYENPPDAVAQIYHEIISNEFKGAFKHIGFAILGGLSGGPHNPRGNLKPFQDLFNP